MPDFLALSPEYHLPWHHWLLALLAAFIIGLNKAGLKGIAALIVTFMAIIFGGKASTGIVLPMLVVGDLFAVWYYHQHTQWDILRKLLPWMIVGVLIGTWIGQDLPEILFKRGMAVIILFSVLVMYSWDRRKSQKVPKHWAFASSMGLLAGITTMIGNLAGAFSNIYFLAMRLPKIHFIGTVAWLFMIVNLFKVPLHLFVWHTITPASLAVNLRLLPALFLGLVVGIRLLRHIREQWFRRIILILTAMGAVLILIQS